MSLLAVHARRRAGEELRGGAKIWNGAKPYDTAAARVEHVRSVVRVRPSIIVGLWPPNPTSKSIIAPPRFVSKNGVIKASVGAKTGGSRVGGPELCV